MPTNRTSKDQTLLVRRDAFLVLDLGLHVFDGVRRFHFQRDGLAGQGLDENLHSSAQAQDQMQRAFLLDVVIGQCATIFQLFTYRKMDKEFMLIDGKAKRRKCTGKNQALLVRRDALFILDLRLHVLDRVRRFHFQRDGLAGQGLHKNLHATSQAQHQVQGGFFLDIVIRQGASVLQLLSYNINKKYCATEM